MGNTNFTTSFVVNQTPEAVFRGIVHVRGWWSEEIEGPTENLHDEFIYRYRDVHTSKIKLIEVVPNEKIVWLVLENRFNFTEDEGEWTGNKMVFEISRRTGQTQVRFTQLGLTPEYECYDICKDAWTHYINDSLHGLITTGKGQPNPKEGGFNEQLLQQHKK
ncbi:SRPBCC family protein [Gaoshiqia sp. Z1-71]|uniref:SRPBCC family protein n=1 Tax=Gaoshiqia hydrogeniformans TaxID=3290090 RepID=UPI003BF7871F